MPLIPRVQESQRLVPSAPVSAISDESARLPASAVENLGAAAFKLGRCLVKIFAVSCICSSWNY